MNLAGKKNTNQKTSQYRKKGWPKQKKKLDQIIEYRKKTLANTEKNIGIYRKNNQCRKYFGQYRKKTLANTEELLANAQ